MCAYHCVQMSYTTQHRAVLIIFPLIRQTSTRAQMLSSGGKGGNCCKKNVRKLLSMINDAGFRVAAAVASIATQRNIHQKTVQRPSYITAAKTVIKTNGQITKKHFHSLIFYCKISFPSRFKEVLTSTFPFYLCWPVIRTVVGL